MTRLLDVLLIGAAAMFLIIGIDQTIVLGFEKGYWAFMLALAAFFAFTYRKGKQLPSPEGGQKKKSGKKPGKPK